MRIKNLFFLAALAVSATATLTSCEDILGTWDRPTPAAVTPTASVAVTGITLDDEATVNVGGTVTLTATVSPDNASDKTITWSSDNTAAATVADGVVTAVGAGTAIITATANDGSGIKATCNVTVKIPGLLAGKFTINASGDQVQFSKGNLQATYDGSAWTWAFAANQWDYIGNAEGNTKVSDSAPFVAGYTGSSTTVDLFGWVGASSTWTGVNQYGITSSIATNATDGYGNVLAESLKSDWGTLAISNGGNTANSGWRTLTGGDSGGEWEYLFNTRNASTVSGTNNARYAKAYLFGTTHGVILFPDSYTHPDGVNPPTGINATNNTSWDANQYSAADWAKMEAAGCVFLPAAGIRNGSSVTEVGTKGNYWSSSSVAVYYNTNAWFMYFYLGEIPPMGGRERSYGHSVRLVYDVK